MAIGSSGAVSTVSTVYSTVLLTDSKRDRRCRQSTDQAQFAARDDAAVEFLVVQIVPFDRDERLDHLAFAVVDVQTLRHTVEIEHRRVDRRAVVQRQPDERSRQ